MKFVVRRAVAGLLLMPVVAGLYVAGYAVLVGAGATPTSGFADVVSNAVVIGLAFVVVFAFWTQIQKFADKVIA
jgi:hypothetical protein